MLERTCLTRTTLLAKDKDLDFQPESFLEKTARRRLKDRDEVTSGYEI